MSTPPTSDSSPGTGPVAPSPTTLSRVALPSSATSSLPSPSPSILARVQQGLERLYRVETNLDVTDFVVDARARDAALTGGQGAEARRPREQLLVHQGASSGDVGLALFVDDAALANLERHDPSAGLHDSNFSDFCLAVEGVSHFVYVAVCAARDRTVSALELELQAEIDKYVSCVLLPDAAAPGDRRPAASGEVRSRLYEQVTFAADLDPEERRRYDEANAQARRYALALERRYLERDRRGDMLVELRRFYRLPLPGKLAHIASD